MTDAVLELDLSRPISAADVPKLGRAFLAWWAGELKMLLPRRIRAAFERVPPMALVVSDQGWQLSRRGDGGDRTLDIDRPAGEMGDELRQFVAASGTSDVAVLVPYARVLIRQIELPILSEARVRPAVALQIDRLTPFKADAARFSCRIVERDQTANKMKVEIAAAPSALIASIEARLAELSLTPTAINVTARDGTSGQGFDLRVPLAGRQSRELLIDAGVAAGAFFIWLIAYYAWIAAGEAEIARWQSKVAEIKPRAERSAELRRNIDLLTRPLEIANARKTVGALAVIKELTALLPDNSRLIELRMSEAGIDITGLAGDAPALIGDLDRSKIFSNVRSKAPLTRLPNAAQDRFDLSAAFEVKGKK
jgi:general secretion pathway protein L